jgi:hypothetical protein
LKDFDDATRDADLPIEVSDWRVARRVWCELRGWPTWLVRFPYKLLILTGEALIVSLAVELVFTVFMVESFHRLSPISPLLNIPAGIAAAIVTPLALLLIFLPGPAAAPIAWAITNLLDLLLKTLHLALQIPYATVRVPSPPAGVWVAYGLAGGALVLSIHKRWRSVCWVGMAAVLGLQLMMMFKDFSAAPPRMTTLTFMDVGQGIRRSSSSLPATGCLWTAGAWRRGDFWTFGMKARFRSARACCLLIYSRGGFEGWSDRTDARPSRSHGRVVRDHRGLQRGRSMAGAESDDPTV